MYYAIDGTKDFEHYLNLKNLRSDFLKLDPNGREKILMKYKWGGSVHDHNMEAEGTRRYLVSQCRNQGVQNMKGDEKTYWEGVLKTEDYFLELKKLYGMIPQEKKNYNVDWSGS